MDFFLKWIIVWYGFSLQFYYNTHIHTHTLPYTSSFCRTVQLIQWLDLDNAINCPIIIYSQGKLFPEPIIGRPNFFGGFWWHTETITEREHVKKYKLINKTVYRSIYMLCRVHKNSDQLWSYSWYILIFRVLSTWKTIKTSAKIRVVWVSAFFFPVSRLELHLVEKPTKYHLGQWPSHVVARMTFFWWFLVLVPVHLFQQISSNFQILRQPICVKLPKSDFANFQFGKNVVGRMYV